MNYGHALKIGNMSFVVNSKMKKVSDSYSLRTSPGFSLAEILAALTIGAMILVSVLAIYGRAENSADSVTRRLDNSRLPAEVLQRIAEDLDGIIAARKDTGIVVHKGKFDHLYPTARLEITKTMYDKENKPQVFEKIIWQTRYDYQSSADGLVLYRSYSGVTFEDKLLDEKREFWEKDYTFVPICEGVTFFRIEVLNKGKLTGQWNNESLPGGVVVTISFAEPVKTLDGTFDVPEEKKVSRIIAIDRTRKIRFRIESKQSKIDEKLGP